MQIYIKPMKKVQIIETKSVRLQDVADVYTDKEKLENVKNIIKHAGGKTYERNTSELEELGYNVYYKVHNTVEFGIPQRRIRVYIMSLKKDAGKNVPFEFPHTEN